MASKAVINGLTLRSTIRSDGAFCIDLLRTEVAAPEAMQIVVKMEGAPINPSDLGLLLGAVDLDSLRAEGHGDGLALHGTVPPQSMAAMRARLDQTLPVGNEGAGSVVLAGEGCEHLLGQTVAVFGGAMFAQYRTVGLNQAMLLPTGTTSAQGAAAFVNPVTALAMLETLKMEGHTALVHTAAASNLGQMLVKLCKADNIPLVNIVRSEGQAQLLRDIGAEHICDSSQESFQSDLLAAITETGATIAFDATGGGTLANDILTAMEQSLSAQNEAFSRYGSTVHKQVYLYGGLDPRPLTLHRTFGLAWGVNGWLMSHCLAKIGESRAAQLRERAASEIATTFASSYVAEISLSDMLNPDIVRKFARRATGEKYLLNPAK